MHKRDDQMVVALSLSVHYKNQAPAPAGQLEPYKFSVL
jgi:hypothetical protein